MSYILTLVAADPAHPLAKSHLREALRIIAHYNIQQTCEPVWLADKKAADIGIAAKLSYSCMLHLREFLEEHKVDFFINEIEKRRKKLLLADMDSTIVTGETLDELAGHAGLKAEVAEITAQAMEGEMDFHTAIRRRVALLKGMPADVLDQTLKATQISKGADTLVKVMSQHGAACVLVSGGFTFFTQAIASKLGFSYNHGNVLEIEENDDGERLLSGKVKEPILDKYAKVEFLRHYMKKMQIIPIQTMAIGDGANDIPMLKIAGLGIGYHPKQVVAEAVSNIIRHGDLTAALYAQGYTQDHIKTKT